LIAAAVAPGAASFVATQPLAIVASVDADGQPWCSALVGPRGSFQVTEPNIVTLSRAARASSADPLWDNLGGDPRVGLLFIDPGTRRRYRVNGQIEDAGADPLVVRVAEAYPNCPQYIQRRHLVVAVDEPENGAVQTGVTLTASEQQLLASSDTLFVSSCHPEGELDASHRGGNPGFVSVLDDRTLRVPDYAGNSMFNTLGNLRLEPRAGLLVVDFGAGEVLQVAGSAEVDLDAAAEVSGGSGRAWTFTVSSWRRAPLGATLHAELLDYSPFNPPVAPLADEPNPAPAGYRPLRVTAKVAESHTALSLHLAPVDGKLPHWRAGHFLPIAVYPPGSRDPVLRTYTISSVPSDRAVRLTVQRELAQDPGLPPGVASSFLHEGIGPGDELLAGPPRGEFTLDDSQRPLVFLSAGIGITPMLAMLRELAAAASPREVTFIHSARSALDRPFSRELGELAGALDHARVYLVNTGERDRRIDAGWLRQVLPFDDYVFYLCGPQLFMQTIYDALSDAGVRDTDVHAEAFGPAALSRRLDRRAADGLPLAEAEAGSKEAAEAATVIFGKSGVQAEWSPQAGTLLSLAEASGIRAPYSCRAGACQTCAVGLVDGEVAYPVEPVVVVPEGQVLTCSAVPRRASDDTPPTIRLDL
jgi:ferredoxin-NADP reductase/predicted pyridoxine 5'-phosphate oxidase superfamily flavin-nucleotide-binding protein